MADRATEISAFLRTTDWAMTSQAPLAGDASARRYLRLTRDCSKTAVLMDAPPETCGSQMPFLTIAAYLASLNLSAPHILQADPDRGLILMEDFGDRTFTIGAAENAEAERRLYSAATDVLCELRRPPMTDLARTGPQVLADMTSLAFTHYAPGTDPAEARAFLTEFQALLKDALTGDPVTTLRDYHAGNLIWLPDRSGPARVGLLDFQDAIAAHPAYDLVSLLQDARRDLQPGLEEVLVNRYVTQTGCDPDAFWYAYCAIGVQRHLRILGVFARLSLDLGKPSYIDFVPRTWDHMIRNLQHPGLQRLSQSLKGLLPAPSEPTLTRLRGP